MTEKKPAQIMAAGQRTERAKKGGKMSRLKIGAAVAVVVAILTGTAYLLTTQRLESDIRADVLARVGRAEKLLMRVSSLEAFDIMARA